MNFTIIEPGRREIYNLDAEDCNSAVFRAGLELGELDFGIVASWKDGSTLNIIVYEYSLIKGDPKAYFGLEGRLYNGNAVLYKANFEGETVNSPPNLADHLMHECTHFQWFDSPLAVEQAIKDGKITRPQISISGEVIWSWSAAVGKPK